MSSSDRERLFDLLADRAGGESLATEEMRELDRLLARHPEVDPGSLESSAAALHLALLEPHLEPLPAALRNRLEHDAMTFLGALEEPRERVAPAPRAASRGVQSWVGWLVAAAAVVLLFVKTTGEGAPGYSEVLSASDVLVASWSRTEDPSAEGVEGSIAWSDELQMGYMLIEGLPANDPQAGQYQLWIFDPARPAEYPVDGGVFDSDGGPIRVPIDAKLAVADPSLFAVTYEPPGGVVVSSRERLILTATPE